MPSKQAESAKGGSSADEDPFLKNTCVYSLSSCMILILVFLMVLPGALVPYLTRLRFIKQARRSSSVPSMEDAGQPARKPGPLLICQMNPVSYASKPPWTYTAENVPVHLCTHVVLPLVGLADFFNNMQNFDSLASAPAPMHLNELVQLRRGRPELRLLAGLGAFRDAAPLFQKVALSQGRTAFFVRNLLRWSLVNRLDGILVSGLFPTPRNRNEAVRLLKKMATLFRHREFLLELPPEAALFRRPNSGKRLAQLVDLAVLPPQWLARKQALNTLLSSGFPPSRLVAGVRFEGIPYSLGEHVSTSEGGTVPYHELCAKRGWKKLVDGELTLLHRGRSWYILEDTVSLKTQATRLMRQGLAGMIVWDVSADDFLGFCGPKNALLETRAPKKRKAVDHAPADQRRTRPWCQQQPPKRTHRPNRSMQESSSSADGAMWPWARRRVVRVRSQLMGSQSRSDLSGCQEDRQAGPYAMLTDPLMRRHSVADGSSVGDVPSFMVDVHVVDEQMGPPPVTQGVEPRLERRFDELDSWRSLESSEARRQGGMMSPKLSPIWPGRFPRMPPRMSPPRAGYMTASPRGAEPLILSPGEQTPILYQQQPVPRNLLPETDSPPLPFMTDKEILSARRHRKERHNMVEWIVTWVFLVTVAVVLLAVLVVFTYRQPRLDDRKQSQISLFSRFAYLPDFNDRVQNRIISQTLSDQNIRSVLAQVALLSNVAGSNRSQTMASYVDSVLRNNNFNVTKIIPYIVTMSYADDTHPNKATRLGRPCEHEPRPPASNRASSREQVVLVSPAGESLRMGTQETSIPGVDMTVNHAYNAYAARGQITIPLGVQDGSIIYANRCLPKDFVHLDAINVRAWDRVLLCRYGPVQSPGEALEAATNVGARGVIFFLDPADVTNGGPSFPQSWWMPGDAIRRSHVRQDEDIGDPMTPGYASRNRYVMFGVPLDGWSNGAVAPGSALAQSLELCRLLAALTKAGWKPRRTIVFAGWDAHEFGEIGVTEFIEGNRHKVSSRTVAYLNSDICSSGSEFAVTASPVYRSSFLKATHLIPDFRNSSVSYYKAWSADVNSRKDESGKPDLPPLRKRGSFLPFVHYAGVPSLDVGFRNNLSKSLYFPAYGTALDTLVLAEKFVDPGFKVHRMCTQLLATLIRMWSDTPLLPYDLTELKGQLNSQFGAMKKTYEATIKKSNISFEGIGKALAKFSTVLDNFLADLEHINVHNPLDVRRANDKMMNLERCFVQEVDASEDQARLRNVVFGLSSASDEEMVAFPMLRDKLIALQSLSPELDLVVAVESTMQHASLITYALQQAAHVIHPNGLL
ncbi:unnamed protein product [Ixodes persulcatus]